MKRLLRVSGFLLALVLAVPPVWAQKTVRLSIATGPTGGIYYPMGGGMANILSKYVPYLEVAAEVTAASVDNCLLLGRERVGLALVVADVGWDAYQGVRRFNEKIPLRAIVAFYPNHQHIVTLEGRGIGKVADLKGRRVSTGTPGSGTEVKALRVLEAYGLDADRDMTRDKLTPGESSNALKDKKIDAYFWDGGIPTASVTELGATPGIKVKLIGHEDAIPKMRDKYGPIYVKGIIPAKTYPWQDADVPIAVVWNIFVCHEKMKENVVYDIAKTLFDRKQELVAVHRNARFLSLETQVTGASPYPYHPGALRYFAEKGLKIR